MDYLLTSSIFIFGICFHIMQKIMSLRMKFPDFSFKMIWKTFFSQEWDSLMVSLLVLLTSQLALFIIRYNQIVTAKWFETWGMYCIALTLGYAGQRLAYKYLGTAEKVLQQKADVYEKRAEEIANKTE